MPRIAELTGIGLANDPLVNILPARSCLPWLATRQCFFESDRMLFDIRQPLPLMIVGVLHLAVLMLFQSGSPRPHFTPPETREVVGYLVRPRIEPKPVVSQTKPEPPTQTPRIEPEKVVEAPPKPSPPVKAQPKPAPKPKRIVKPKISKPSESAISTPPEPPEPVPAMPAPAAAPTPVPPVAAPMPSASPAPAAPPPVAAPRFDAAYLNNPAPDYPPLSRRMGEEGRVMLRVHVGPDGRALEVRLHASSGSARLDNAAQDAVSNWRFVPATQAGVPVAAWVLVPVGFRLDQ